MMPKIYALILLPFLLFSCIKKDKNTVNIGLLNGPSSIIFSNAIEEMSYHEGKYVRYQVKDNPQHLRALIQSNNLDMALIPMTMAYNMIENNFNIRIVAITGWGNLYLISKDSITSFQDLEGESISVPGEGQTPDLVGQFLINYCSLQEKIKLNYTYPSPILLSSALAVNKIKYAILPEPLVSIALEKMPELKRSLNLAEYWQTILPNVPLVQTVLIVRDEFFQENKTWFTSYNDHLKENTLSNMKQPELALNLAIKHEFIPQHTTDTTIINNCKLDYKQDTSIAKDITNYLKTFYDITEDFNINKYLIFE